MVAFKKCLLLLEHLLVFSDSRRAPDLYHLQIMTRSIPYIHFISVTELLKSSRKADCPMTFELPYTVQQVATRRKVLMDPRWIENMFRVLKLLDEALEPIPRAGLCDGQGKFVRSSRFFIEL